jgi:hypothetical protein
MVCVPLAEHLIARTRGGDRSLISPERASWLWHRLRREIPSALSNVIMPDHPHLVAPPGCLPCFRRVLTGFTVKFGVRFEIHAPEPAHTAAIAGRMIRYGFFNPVRAGLVVDPWAWPWSTLRDLGGASYPAWVTLAALGRALGRSPGRLMQGLATLGDHAARTPRRAIIAVATTQTLRAAVASALRVPFDLTLTHRIARRLVVQTSYQIAHPNPRSLALELGCSTSTIHRTSLHPGLDAVLLCLSDPRLHAAPGTP